MTRCFLDRLPWNRRWRTEDFGRSLVAHALDEARASGIKLVLLVGDEPYYGKLGFRRIPVGRITLPGPVDATGFWLRNWSLAPSMSTRRVAVERTPA